LHLTTTILTPCFELYAVLKRTGMFYFIRSWKFEGPKRGEIFDILYKYAVPFF